jgi:hypothetical protein
MKSAKEFLELVEKLDGKSAKDPGYSLRDWFKDGGWVQAGGKYDGKPCARQPRQKTKPYCRDPDDRAAMSKKERNKRAAKKRKEDPNPNRSGEAKMVVQKEAAGEKDACYKKVKSRYKVWPSAYASGALTRCRKVGASNWGNKSEEMDLFDMVYDFLISEDLDEQDVLDIMARVPIEEILEVMELEEEFKDLTPEKEKRVQNRVGELARDIQLGAARVKELRNKPFARHRPGVQKQAAEIIKNVKNKHNLVQNASDALIRTSTSRSAKIQKEIEDRKQKIRDLGGEA